MVTEKAWKKAKNWHSERSEGFYTQMH